MSSRPSLKRGCRVYQSRTRELVSSAIKSWSLISGVRVEYQFPSGIDCTAFSGFVKKLLAREVTDDPSLQMGYQSIKKLLPDSCRCMESGLLDDLVARLGSAPPVLPDGYLEFVAEEVALLFPKGWDSSYERHCVTTTPPLSSAINCSRSSGGCLGGSESLGGQADYLDRVLHGRGGRLCPSYRGQMMVVQSAGKPRPLSKFPIEMLYLKPCHKALYDRLSRFTWLLRGAVTSERLQRAGFKPWRGRLVSGDYKSATDGLSIEVMETALSAVFRNSTFVPSNVRELALRACRPILFSESFSEEIVRGQMMGSLLSFPMLCLQNYLAFKWSLKQAGVKRFVPVVINGDDILYQSPFEGFDQMWRATVVQIGLEVEESKTSVSGLYGSLNSTLVKWDCGVLSPTWSPRFGMLRAPEDFSSLGKTFESFLFECPPHLRFVAGREFFKWHAGTLRRVGFSLTSIGFRGLLARRLAKVFGLLGFEHFDCPRFPLSHDCGLPEGFASQVPFSCTDPELRFASAVETAAMVWARRFKPVERTRLAVRYCLELTALKNRGRRSVFVPDFSISTRFGVFLSRETRGVRDRKAWLAPRFTEELVNIACVVLADSFEWCALPSYDDVPVPYSCACDFGHCKECRAVKDQRVGGG
ncbi:RNA dependent RNA polymerase [Plasmopara viticola lesion associated ourmia-like virus 46]|uniref:RNA dependent RNA polymerase n=1 Tax=Plasmopara viticola lesion associated ourmia-like virus 46 TaxID=2686516 RepID=A0ABX6FJV9_9VIRU|nr:RNA dependent RNA polymerase [Plasmopara viticola lesion associated ourmia-like virus 46]QGY72576.1 RNA dependent RNA polymerase [Plasmopara viticola lesion associated ourmia-like virus 46]